MRVFLPAGYPNYELIFAVCDRNARGAGFWSKIDA